MTTRRGFLTGLTAIVAAPAIVRASSLMPIKALPFDTATARMVAYEHWQFGQAYPYGLRDLLLPGLVKIKRSYTEIPTQWARMFEDAALASGSNIPEVLS